MFYSPVYLKKTGRFGLIWLSATRTKILSKRELAAINMSRICSDILTHIPGMKRDKDSRATRFSLYLSCQLMYGCVRVLQKQWEFLLVDAQALCKRCTDTPSTTFDIDLGATRQAASIESNVPRDDRHANLDPFFGVTKEATIDIESMMVYLESVSESRMLKLEPLSMPARPEIGSPHSVSDPQQIQIRDVMSPMAVQTFKEPDLPKMDIESFMSITRDESFQEIQERLGVVREQETNENQSVVDGQIVPSHEGPESMIETEDRYVSMMRDVLMDCLPQTDILRGEIGQLPPLEETPVTKPTSDMPRPPHKPKVDGPKRQRDPSRKGSKFQDICNGDIQPDQSIAPVAVQTSSDDSFLLNQQRKEMEKEQAADDRGHGHDWAQKNAPSIDLPPITTNSPLRKKRPHKLVIDQFLKISKHELSQNMGGTSDIILPMQLPDTTKDRNVYREPALSYMRQKAFVGLFTKNCKFGLKMDDTGSEPDSLPSPRLSDFLSRKRARGLEDAAETPANKIPRHSTSEVASMEKARNRTEDSLLESLDRNLSNSLIGEESVQKRSSSSRRGHPSLPFENDTSKDGSIPEIDRNLSICGALTTWPEERELNVISPIRHVPETSAQNFEVVVQTSFTDEPVVIAPEKSPQQEQAIASNEVLLDSSLINSDTPRTAVYKLVENNLRSKNDWTTFQAVCPTSKYNRKIAASMFNALCAQIASGKLCARQDEPYASIFIWVEECTSGLSASTSTES